MMESSETENESSQEKEETIIEITKSFLEAVKCLELGELLHDPCFGLFEAMSAIEMMDPKMDAGMMCNRGKRVILNFEQSVEAGILKLSDLTPEELIGIMDTTFSCLVTWLEGHSLAQTVFTNLYLHNPSAVQDKYLRAFCLGTLKEVDVIEECVSKASVFEEEDFQPSLYGYNLATQFSDAKVTSVLRECEDEIGKRTRTGKGINQEDNEKWLAVQARLRFTRVLHLLLLNLWKRDSLGDCPKLLGICTDSLSTILKTHGLGLARTTGESEPFMLGFELLVNQRLLPPTFPRSTRIRGISETFTFLENLVTRIKAILKVTSLTNFHQILEFFSSFSESGPDVLSRSLLQLLYSPLRFKKPGVEDMIDSMKESVKNFISPPFLTSKSSLAQSREVLECVDMFFDRCTTVFSSLLMLSGHNRARQRDRLIQILEDFATLQLETDRIDAYLHSLSSQSDSGIQPHLNCFGNWLLYHISKIMIRYTLTGFELELYAVHEFGYLYWYLFEFLYGWLLSSLSRAESFVSDLEALSTEKLNKKAVKGRIKTQSKRNKAYTKEICLTQAEQHMAGGYFKAMMGLFHDGKIPVPRQEFDTEDVRYGHRFSAFSSIRTPAPVHYPQYRAAVEFHTNLSSEQIYTTSARCFLQAKQFLEAIPNPEKEVNDLLKIAKTNVIVLKLLASGHKRDSRVPPDFDFTCHTHFPIIKVK